MKSNPYILINGWKIQPEHRERIGKWLMEVNYPLNIKSGFMKGQDRYQIAIENPDYLRTFTITHYEYFGQWDDWLHSPGGRDVYKDMSTWISKGIAEPVWGANYQLIRGFRNDGEPLWANAERGAENAPIMHLEGYNLTSEAEKEYVAWLKKWGYDVFIPLVMKLPWIKEYGCYRIVEALDIGLFSAKDFSVHPRWLSILHFDDIKAFEEYEKSVELAALKFGIHATFPAGMDYKWYVQYQLMKSWRK